MDYVLTTERLVLRPVTAGDHAALLAHWTLPDVRRFLFDGEALSAAEVTETIEESIRDFAAGGYGIWRIEERGRPGQPGTAGLAGTAELAGTAGLRPLEEIGLEIFYSLAPGSWGRGYATEAARAVVGHALVGLGLPEVLAEVDEGNTASVAVAKRLGMTPFAVVPGRLGPMTRYRTTAAPSGLPPVTRWGSRGPGGHRARWRWPCGQRDGPSGQDTAPQLGQARSELSLSKKEHVLKLEFWHGFMPSSWRRLHGDSWLACPRY